MPFQELSSILEQFTISDKEPEPAISENMYYLEVLVATHARKMVETNRWRSLIEFANCLSFPVSAWLRQERFEINTDGLFKALHVQFGLSMPGEVCVVWCGVKMAETGHRRESETGVRRRESEGSIGRRSISRDVPGRRLSTRSSISLTPPEVERFENQLWSKANVNEVELFFKMHRNELVLIREFREILERAGEGYEDIGVMLAIMVMDFEWLRGRVKVDVKEKERFVWILKGVESVGYRELEKHVLRE